METAHFIASDGWLLAAIFWAHRREPRVEIDDIVFFSDALSHDIPSFGEVFSSMSRLCRAGFIEFTDGVVAPGGEAVTLYRDFESLDLRTIDSAVWLSDKLRRYPLAETQSSTCAGLSGFLTPTAYEAAVTRYRERM